MKYDTEAQSNGQTHTPPAAPDALRQQPRMTARSKAALADTAPRKARRLGGGSSPVWRHWYDPCAGPPVAQTVQEGLARAAKAKPGTVPEVEMLTSEELQQRMEMIRAREHADESSSETASGKR